MELFQSCLSYSLGVQRGEAFGEHLSPGLRPTQQFAPPLFFFLFIIIIVDGQAQSVSYAPKPFMKWLLGYSSIVGYCILSLIQFSFYLFLCRIEPKITLTPE